MRSGSSFRVIALLASFISAGCDEMREKRYSDTREARQIGRLGTQSSRLPSFIPESATRIVERSDVDTNATWGTFNYSAVDDESMKAQLIPLSAKEVAGIRVGIPDVITWWPSDLSGRIETNSSAYDFYRFPTKIPHVYFDSYLIAVSKHNDKVFFWTASGFGHSEKNDTSTVP